MKKILVTGTAGFLGKNLIERLKRIPDYIVLQFDEKDIEETLYAYCREADVVFHVGSANHPDHGEEIDAGIADVTLRIVALLLGRAHKPRLVLASSIQAALDSPFGRSARKAEDALEAYGSIGGDAVILRLPEVFGKWSHASKNFVVATCCHNIAHGLDIAAEDPDQVVELIYIDDVVSMLVSMIDDAVHVGTRRVAVSPVTSISMKALVGELQGIRDIRISHVMPDMDDRFRRSLYATYLSFLPENTFAYGIMKKEGDFGVLAEFLTSKHAGQLLVLRTKPGFVWGNYYHDTKIGKIFVVDGNAIVRFREIVSDTVLSYAVSGQDFSIIDIPPGYTHSIENAGNTELVVLLWSSEAYIFQEAYAHQLVVQA